VWNSSELTGLVSTAHTHGTKVLLTIILQDFGAGTPHMCSGLSHAATTIANTVGEVTAKRVDGVDVDYEGLNGSCGTGDPSWARHAFTNMVASLRSHLPSGSYLAVDTYASSATDTLGFFDVRGLSPSVDSLFVMAYDLEYSNYARVPVNCSRFCLGPTAPLAGYYYNDWTAASQYVSAVGAAKVILGVPYYGRKACVASATANQYPTGSVGADTYLDAIGESTAPGVQSGSYATPTAR
jgi:GH18 family chitinase